MAETKCEFDLLQRVTVPNGDDIVGVIVGRNESIEAPPMYSMQWTGLKGRTEYGTFAEAEVRLFNPPPKYVAPSVDVDALAQTAAKISKTRYSWQLAPPKRKPARKTKSRRK